MLFLVEYPVQKGRLCRQLLLRGQVYADRLREEPIPMQVPH
jgi:hypothetical protein